MHTFWPKPDDANCYNVIFCDPADVDATPTKLFTVPSIQDAVAAVSILNGGSGSFMMVQQPNVHATITVRTKREAT